jgi:hypothetical protein
MKNFETVKAKFVTKFLLFKRVLTSEFKNFVRILPETTKFFISERLFFLSQLFLF